MDCQLDLAAHQIAEINSSGAWNRGEIYAGARHLGTYNNGTTFFNHEDWLGTERARSNVTGVVCETIVSLPYGDGQNTAGSCGDESPMHFTGKMRDTESNLDDFDARYYSSQWGRFMIPDWDAKPVDVPYAKFGDPQSLNLYGYVRNNPSTMRDSDGHCGQGTGDFCSKVTVHQEVSQKPEAIQNQKVTVDGKTVKETGVEGKITFTVKENGQAAAGVQVNETNQETTTRNGEAQKTTLIEGQGKTNADGQIGDNITTAKVTDGKKATNEAIKDEFKNNTWTSTDTQTLTLQFPSGPTCTATSTRTMTNAGPNGPSSTYVLTPTEPVVKQKN